MGFKDKAWIGTVFIPAGVGLALIWLGKEFGITWMGVLGLCLGFLPLFLSFGSAFLLGAGTRE